jgi:hypothetical protein
MPLRRLLLLAAAPLLMAIVVGVPREPAPPSAEWFVLDETRVEECPPGQIDCLRQALSNIAYREGGRAALGAMEDRFRVDDVFFNNCHGTAHALGGAVYARTRDIEDSLLEGGSTCGYGFYHGVVEHAFSINDIDPAAAGEVCASLATPADRDQCSHGAGHAFGSDGTPAEAADRCRIFGESSGPELGAASCYSGAFMEGFVGALGPPRWTEGMRACDAIDPVIRPDCYGQAAIARLSDSGRGPASYEYAHLGCGGLVQADLDGCVRGWSSQLAGKTEWQERCRIAENLEQLCAKTVGEMEAVFRMPTPWLAAESCEREFAGSIELVIACAEGAGRRLSLAECELFRVPEALFACRRGYEDRIR